MINRLPRCAAVAAAATAGHAALLAWSLPLAAAGPTDTLDRALVRACAVAAVLAATWLWVGTLGTALAVARRRPESARTLPAPVRRVVLAACGVALTGGLVAGPAHATPGQPHEDRGAPPVASALPLPERPTTPAEVVVRRGDSLWSIAEDDLGGGAADAAVDTHWRDVYALNRAVIGPDPDLILPAQRLRMPAR